MQLHQNMNLETTETVLLHSRCLTDAELALVTLMLGGNIADNYHKNV